MPSDTRRHNLLNEIAASHQRLANHHSRLLNEHGATSRPENVAFGERTVAWHTSAAFLLTGYAEMLGTMPEKPAESDDSADALRQVVDYAFDCRDFVDRLREFAAAAPGGQDDG